MRSLGKPAYFHGGRGEEVFQQLDQVLAEKLSTAQGAFSDAMYDQCSTRLRVTVMASPLKSSICSRTVPNAGRTAGVTAGEATSLTRDDLPGLAELRQRERHLLAFASLPHAAGRTAGDGRRARSARRLAGEPDGGVVRRSPTGASPRQTAGNQRSRPVAAASSADSLGGHAAIAAAPLAFIGDSGQRRAADDDV